MEVFTYDLLKHRYNVLLQLGLDKGTTFVAALEWDEPSFPAAIKCVNAAKELCRKKLTLSRIDDIISDGVSAKAVAPSYDDWHSEMSIFDIEGEWCMPHPLHVIALIEKLNIESQS